MTIAKIAAVLSLASALSLACYEPAQSAELTSRFAVAKRSAEQIQVVKVRSRRGWYNGAGAPPSYYGGSYLGYPYGLVPGDYGYIFPFGYGYRPYGGARPY